MHSQFYYYRYTLTNLHSPPRKLKFPSLDENSLFVNVYSLFGGHFPNFQNHLKKMSLFYIKCNKQNLCDRADNNELCYIDCLIKRLRHNMEMIPFRN